MRDGPDADVGEPYDQSHLLPVIECIVDLARMVTAKGQKSGP